MFHDPLILYFALVAIPISTLAGIAVRKLFYVGPPTFEEPDYYALGTSAPFAGSMVDNNAVGRTGELVTAIMMVQRGWRQLPSEKDVKGNTRGLDGLFVRQLNKRVGGYEICIAETKASSTRATPSSAKYRPEDMADAMVKRKLEDLRDTRHDDGRAYLDEKVANQIISAIGTKYLSKRLFIHSFELSESSIYELSTTGDIGESPIEIISHGQHA
ncbi:MAG TPA: hypothetical protein VEH07_05375, partial [Alphaproteobacteria bacterium]|nr:hypothetical protein [Alphaproteobacteria bacterium]